ncbi:MAG: DUF2169 domain-containing protein [Myxococcota bacterium]
MSPVPCRALAASSLATTFWRQGSALRVGVVLKACFRMHPGEPMTKAKPTGVREFDLHLKSNPARSLVAPSDLVPYRPRADLMLRGRAYAHGAKRAVVRFMVNRQGRPLLDKKIIVHGPRELRKGGKATSAKPFHSILVDWERAAVGVENPYGINPSEGVPNLEQPEGGAPSFGPVVRYAQARRRLLGNYGDLRLEGPVLELPPSINWEYFQYAPRDQQIDFLKGDEWVSFVGMHPELSEVSSQLPRLNGLASIAAMTPDAAASLPGTPEAEAWLAVPMVADQLIVDADNLLCEVSWRGGVPVRQASAVHSLRLAGAVLAGDEAAAWPAPHEVVQDHGGSTDPRVAAAAAAVVAQRAAQKLENTPFSGLDLTGLEEFETSPPLGEVPNTKTSTAGRSTLPQGSGEKTVEPRRDDDIEPPTARPGPPTKRGRSSSAADLAPASRTVPNSPAESVTSVRPTSGAGERSSGPDDELPRTLVDEIYRDFR